MATTAEATVSDRIDRFQAENQKLALVLDGGELVGLDTTTDAFEGIARDLKDPTDARADRSP